jgi:hypothetical protein
LPLLIQGNILSGEILETIRLEDINYQKPASFGNSLAIFKCIGKTKFCFILVQVQFRLLTRAAQKISAAFNLRRAR